MNDRRQELIEMDEIELHNHAVDLEVYAPGMTHEEIVEAVLAKEAEMQNNMKEDHE